MHWLGLMGLYVLFYWMDDKTVCLHRWNVCCHSGIGVTDTGSLYQPIITVYRHRVYQSLLSSLGAKSNGRKDVGLSLLQSIKTWLITE